MSNKGEINKGIFGEKKDLEFFEFFNVPRTVINIQFFKGKYAKLKKEEQEKKDHWDNLQKKMVDMNIPEEERIQIKNEILHKEAEIMRMKLIILFF